MTVHVQKKLMVAINVIGGSMVIFSYIYGLLANPESGPALWGNVPLQIRPLYTVSMFSAAAGYLAFTYYILFRLDADEARIGERFSYCLFNWLYLLILIPSAVWMPLTFAMIGRPSLLLWISIRIVLAAVGIGSVCMLGAIIAVKPKGPAWPHALAVIGCVAFCVQTAILDALVWTAYFPLNC